MSIRIEQLSKVYQGVPVVNDVTLEIRRGEFFVLLGPSGSGKSTLLRALAGLTQVDRGRIWLNGRDVTALPARARGIGVVFQHYALFRHMTVADNIEFALRVRRVAAGERRRRRRELLRLVALEGYDERFPSQLSGGQQQRVAVARALAHEPAVLLLDEPFGALDSGIRVELRETVRAVQRRLGMTTILVTHDREESFALADRIGIMQMGRLLESGSPESLYRHPSSRFVARFLGAANLLLGERTPAGIRLGSATVPAAPGTASGTAPQGDGAETVLVIRPEDVEVAPAGGSPARDAFARGTVRALMFAGHQQHLDIELGADAAVRAATGAADATGAVPRVQALRSAHDAAAVPLAPGAAVTLGIRRLHALPTPISSFRLLGAPAAAAPDAHPLLAQLVRSMQARVIDDAGGPDGPVRLEAGICVLALDAQAPAAIASAIARGARRILCLPAAGTMPTRMLVCADGGARDGALRALVASIMRHLPVEASAVTLQEAESGAAGSGAPEPAAASANAPQAGVSQAQAAPPRAADALSGLRASSYRGGLGDWLAGLRAGTVPTLVALALPAEQPALDATLRRELAPLYAAGPGIAALLAIEHPR